MKMSQYTKEFRDTTIQLVLNSNKPAIQIAKDLDVNEKTLYNWLRIHKHENNIKTESKSPMVVTSKNTVKETLEAENKRLRAENKILKQERDILKKATAYFAKEVR
jgi:transposase